MAALVLLAQETSTSNSLAAFFPLILVVGLFFLLIMPQRRMRKAQQQLQTSLVLGERVRTAGGIHGTIEAIDDATVTLKVESGVLKFERRAIVAKVED